jgi:diguanylate cyclase (GGDEF)-like protein
VAAVPVRHGTRTVAVFALVESGEVTYSMNDLDALGEVAGLLGVTIERLRLYEQAEHSARHDALTGLPNYRYLQERLGRLRAGIEAPGSSAVFLVDMDSLKLFNDTLGHEAGDRVIQIVARALRDAVSDADFVARTGGDEFVVVMEGVDAEGAQAAADRMHEALREAHLEFPNAPCSVGISVGVAMAPADAESTADLMQLADHAMYSAKFGGGNRTLFATGGIGGTVPASLRGRQSRLLELTMQACTDGATGVERAALARAERYVAGIAERYHLSEVRETSLRLLVAAEVGQRITQSGSELNRRIADVLVRGARAEVEGLAPSSAAMLTKVPTALVDLAWMQRSAPDAELDLATALQELRARFVEQLPDRLLDDIAEVARADAARQPEHRAA